MDFSLTTIPKWNSLFWNTIKGWVSNEEKAIHGISLAGNIDVWP